MPYGSISELPESVRKPLSGHEQAQKIYKEAFNNAYDQYDKPSERRGKESREEASHKVAWSAVKTKYKKGENGKWQKK